MEWTMRDHPLPVGCTHAHVHTSEMPAMISWTASGMMPGLAVDPAEGRRSERATGTHRSSGFVKRTLHRIRLAGCCLAVREDR